MKLKKIILTIVTIIWMGLIFALSNDNATQSKKKSDTFIDRTIYKVCQVVSNDCSKKDARKKRKPCAFFNLYSIRARECVMIRQ